ncbi:hypothetical protein F5Y14DRAFT_292339 [Nemania sp. NC0429]|nr:hypothetical protein F5Y14DRAFT_292339 [Nemania sp. NC0429]
MPILGPNGKMSNQHRSLAVTRYEDATTTTLYSHKDLSLNPAKPSQEQSSAPASPPFRFSELPLEIREMIWTFALPESRVFSVLVWSSVTLNMQLLNRYQMRMPLASVCFESRRVVKEAGYVLAFRDEDEVGDTGVWFHPRRDTIDRTIWGPGDWNMGT